MLGIISYVIVTYRALVLLHHLAFLWRFHRLFLFVGVAPLQVSKKDNVGLQSQLGDLPPNGLAMVRVHNSQTQERVLTQSDQGATCQSTGDIMY